MCNMAGPFIEVHVCRCNCTPILMCLDSFVIALSARRDQWRCIVGRKPPGNMEAGTGKHTVCFEKKLCIKVVLGV